MSTSQAEITGASALSVRVTDLDLSVDLSDGRTITVPVAWFPRIAMGTQQERENWSLIGGGHGIHWPNLDEDISVESLLTGQRSRERASSLRKWMENRGVR
ncbi:MAG TPA: DUF2442 domain-containing protein [Bryobacteraceae bacterium]|nr:DUF2442 domain-containing protein [Bryobacteraceae bacterium]